jgi:RHS repeat-associated protein
LSNSRLRSGQMQLPAGYDRAYLQGLFDAFTDNGQFEERNNPLTPSGGIRGYTNRSFPMALRAYISDATWKNIHYFDNYDWRYNDANSGTIAQYGFQPNPYNSTAYSTTNAKGLMTGSLHKIDNFGDFPFPSTVHYDDKNRPIQSIVYQDLYARNQSDTKYNFVGESLISQMIYRKRDDLDRVITKENTLDHMGRTKDFYYTLREGTVDKVPRLRMNSLFYDNIGRLQMKVIEPRNNVTGSLTSGDWSISRTWMNGIVPNLSISAVINQGHTLTIPAGATVQAGSLYDAGTLKFFNNSRLILGSLAPVRGAGLQTINYSYNVRSQMRGVNLDENDNPQVSQNKLFSYKLDYHEDGRYFDGSISKMTWKSSPLTPGGGTGTRSYTYTYDRANRLLNSQYSGVGNENYSVSNSYDANGNILTLQRYSKTGTNTFGLVDNLTYSYLNNGNKLLKIDDGISGNALANDFRDVAGNDYTFSVDGKLTKDGNKSITNIDYNYLDLVSKVTFADGTKVETFYTSTGERRQRRVTKNGVTSYTLYDGEMVYQFTGNVTSLNDYKVSEIQNPEGRFVTKTPPLGAGGLFGHLEYGYTDHVGNLRLSYKDSLGVAFITQSQHYDPWSNVNSGSEYQLAGIQGDRYLVSGKETDNLTGNILLDWRDYDSVTGRMNSFDPADQSMSISGFSYCLNNPVMRVDPDGRFAFMPFLMMTLFSGHISGMISQGNGGSYGKGFLTGAVTSAIGGGVGAGMAGILGQAGTLGGSILRGAAGGFVSGGISGGIGSMMNGGSFGDGFLGGAISGGISGGIMGGLTFKKPTLHMTPFNSDGTTYSPMEATDQNLDTFCQEQFCGDYKNDNGIHSITTENIKVPKIYRDQIRYDANERLFFKPDGSPVGGITIDYNIGCTNFAKNFPQF